MIGYLVFSKNPTEFEGVFGGIFFSKEDAITVVKRLKRDQPNVPVYIHLMTNIEPVEVE